MFVLSIILSPYLSSSKIINNLVTIVNLKIFKVDNWNTIGDNNPQKISHTIKGDRHEFRRD